MEESPLPPARLPFASQPRIVRLALLMLFLATCSLWFPSRALLSANFRPLGIVSPAIAAFSGPPTWLTCSSGCRMSPFPQRWSAFFARPDQAFPIRDFSGPSDFLSSVVAVTHFIEILTIWQPVYWLAVAAKILTAVSFFRSA